MLRLKSVPLQSLPNVLRPTLTAGHLLHSAESGEVGARGRRLGMAALHSVTHSGGAPHSGVPQRAGVETALASGVPVDSVDDAGVTALFVAAMNGMAPKLVCLFRHLQLPHSR